jgi:hypothetical protein
MSDNIIPINKDEIDLTNPFIKDTFFEFAKKSEVGSGNDKIDLESDDFVTFQFISGKYDLNSLSDRYMIDNDKIIVINTIHMYRSGLDYEKLFELIKDNKYCYLFLETVLKDNPYTKEIVDHLLNIYDKDTYQPIVDCNGYTVLIWTCKNKMPKVALKLIEKFGGLCKPKQVNNDHNTALMEACYYGITAHYFASENNMNDVVSKLKTLLDDQ